MFKNSIISKLKLNRESVELIKISLPVIGAMLLQMTYNLTDMIWIGKLGSDAIAAVGTAGFYINLGWALSNFITIGTGIKISHGRGAKQYDRTVTLALNGFIIASIIAVIFSSSLYLTADSLINFFNLSDIDIHQKSVSFLKIGSIGAAFTILNLILISILNGHGKTSISFKGGLVGTVCNVVLDPLAIFVLDLGVEGAAYATVISKIASFSILFIFTLREGLISFNFNRYFDISKSIEAIKLGIPAALQRLSFMLVSIAIGKLVSDWGTAAIAAQRVGLQIEAFTYMFVGGLSQAISIAVGQSYGARDGSKIKRLYTSGIKIAIISGSITTALFLIFPNMLLSIFVEDSATIEIGVRYLSILAVSQIFMSIEMISAGSFNGCGDTKKPAIISVLFTTMRVPLAYALGCCFVANLDGIWWSISISSIIKGTLLSVLFYSIMFSKNGKLDKLSES